MSKLGKRTKINSLRWTVPDIDDTFSEKLAHTPAVE